MRHIVFSLWAVSLCLSTADAQQVLRKEPVHYAGPDGASRAGARPPGMRLRLRNPREFALAPLSEAELLHLAEPGTRLKVGIQRKLAPDALATGGWETTAEGTRVWRMALRSPGSQAMRVEFLNFSAGAGNVWLHSIHRGGAESMRTRGEKHLKGFGFRALSAVSSVSSAPLRKLEFAALETNDLRVAILVSSLT
jgi:hypothetical protein